MATVAEVQHRQSTIVALTRETGRCTVSELASQFDVTPETIRRDLKVLENQGLLRRVHGGAVLRPAHNPADLLAVDDDDELPVHQSQRRKQSIGQKALSLIPGPNASMLIDAGSTTEAFANVLARNYLGQNWSVVTTSPNIAKSLASAGVPNVSMIGGTVKPRTQAVVGPRAQQELRVLRADIAFVGTSGFSMNRGFTTSDYREAEIKKLMIAQANYSVILCDSAKIAKDSTMTFATPDEVEVVISDRNAPDSLESDLHSTHTKLVIP